MKELYNKTENSKRFRFILKLIEGGKNTVL